MGQSNHARQLSKQLLVPHSRLGFLGDVGHSANALEWVVSLGRLTAEHNAVGTVKDSIGYIRALGTGWTRLLDHRLEHLRSANDGLAGLQKEMLALIF